MNYPKFAVIVGVGILIASNASAQLPSIRGTFVGADPSNTVPQDAEIDVFFSPFNAAGLWLDQSGNEGSFNDDRTLSGGNTGSSTTGTGGYLPGVGDVDIVTTIRDLTPGESYAIDFIHSNTFTSSPVPPPYSVGFAPDNTSQVANTNVFMGWLEEEVNTDGLRVWDHEIGITTADENGEINVYINLLPVVDPPIVTYTGTQAYNGVAFSSVLAVGDFNNDNVVDCADIDEYRGMIGADATGDAAAFDLVADGTIDGADVAFLIEMLVETTNGQVGTFLGDVNCDGQVNVLGDALQLVTNLGMPVASYADGDINLDGQVNVLGDALILVTNLGLNNAN